MPTLATLALAIVVSAAGQPNYTPAQAFTSIRPHALVPHALVAHRAVKQECESTCLDYCQTRGADMVDVCSCNFGMGDECACLCSDDEGSHHCGDFPGCVSAQPTALARRR
jgi:hypothetical protein